MGIGGIASQKKWELPDFVDKSNEMYGRQSRVNDKKSELGPGTKSLPKEACKVVMRGALTRRVRGRP